MIYTVNQSFDQLFSFLPILYIILLFFFNYYIATKFNFLSFYRTVISLFFSLLVTTCSLLIKAALLLEFNLIIMLSEP